jgi:hypothetical protein
VLKKLNRINQFLISAFILISIMVGCSHSQVVEEKPITEKLGGYTNVVIEAVATDKKAEYYVSHLSSMMMKRLTKSKLFPSVSMSTGSDSVGDLLIKGDIFDAKLPEEKSGITISGIGEAKIKLNIRYTITSLKDKKVLGVIQAASDSGGQSSFGGFKTNTDTGYAFGRSCDELVKFMKKNM